MAEIRLVCVGKFREKHYIAAFEEYKKRLSAFCRFELVELPEERLPEDPSEREIAAALEREAEAVLRAVPKGAALIALCVEGKHLSSPELAAYVQEAFLAGRSRLCFVIGGSYGLAPEVKRSAALKLSMSRMTFPHHLARVMLAEQLYRAFTILEGRKYHK